MYFPFFLYFFFLNLSGAQTRSGSTHQIWFGSLLLQLLLPFNLSNSISPHLLSKCPLSLLHPSGMPTTWASLIHTLLHYCLWAYPYYVLWDLSHRQFYCILRHLYLSSCFLYLLWPLVFPVPLVVTTKLPALSTFTMKATPVYKEASSCPTRPPSSRKGCFSSVIWDMIWDTSDKFLWDPKIDTENLFLQFILCNSGGRGRLFKASLIYRMSAMTAKTTQRNPVSRNKQTNKIK